LADDDDSELMTDASELDDDEDNKDISSEETDELADKNKNTTVAFRAGNYRCIAHT